MQEVRKNIFEEVKRILQGPIPPFDNKNKKVNQNPLDFHINGLLYPQLLRVGETENNEDTESERINKEKLWGYEEGNAETTENESISQDRYYNEDTNEDILELSTKYRPSVAGLSFILEPETKIEITVSYAIYKKYIEYEEVSSGEKYPKILYQRQLHNISIELTLDENKNVQAFYNNQYVDPVEIQLPESASLSVVKRDLPDKNHKIITLSLINCRQADSFKNQRTAENCIFEISISANCIEGASFLPFMDQTNDDSLNNEDLNLKLLYRNYKKYALGHGISVNWTVEDGVAKKVYTQALPVEYVNGMELNPEEFKNKDILYIKRLAGNTLNKENYNWQQIKKELLEFINLYSAWIKKQENSINKNDVGLSEKLIEKANDNLKSCWDLYERMKSGIETLDKNDDARKAFEDANRAMFIQRVMGDFSKHRRENDRVLHNNKTYDDPLPNYSKIPYDANSDLIWENGELRKNLKNISNKNKKPLARWFPFQLAFLLSQVNGIIDTKSDDRDTTDLIWFPTGGGKTEAYLGLTAFSIFHRRLQAKREKNDPDKGAGVSVLMRYTLRLLNKQQFERASVLIVACDIIRRNEPNNYGKKRISNGIWVGRSLTPNKIGQEGGQIKQYSDYIRQVNRNNAPNKIKLSPPILSCPACGNRLVKERRKEEPIGRWGYFRIRNRRNEETGPYLICCTNSNCDFHTSNENFEEEKLLPVYEVDEIVYKKRPSLLFSTVDKFVQLAWNKECSKLFNLEPQNDDAGVERIFSAPDLILQDELHLINSSLGTAYGVFEFVIDKLSESKGGKRAKVVSATATARAADVQSKRLYARSHYMQFPPSGINADDSFYARKKETDNNARMYVGFMPAGVTTSTAIIRLASVLLERIPALGQFNNKELDPYYTLVVYFNAIKELGKFRTFLEDDITAYREILAKYFNTVPKQFSLSRINELSSVLTSDEITKSLDKLEKTTLPENKELNDYLGLQDDLYNKGIRNLKDFQIAANRSLITKNHDFFEKYKLKYLKMPEKPTDKQKNEIYKNNYSTVLNFISQILEDKDPSHIAPATSMISVGVDIPRLNTMIINGQPKTSAEYIQASSRVGRGHPGIIFTFLAPTKNRDRSHYEQFKDFHQAYYRYVESSSVTPEAEQALEKMIPTTIIALMKSLNASNGNIINYIETIKDELIERFPEQSINKIICKMEEKINRLGGNRRLANYMDYQDFDRNTNMYRNTIGQERHQVYNAPANLKNNPSLEHHLSTLQSLRNVEQNSGIKIK